MTVEVAEVERRLQDDLDALVAWAEQKLLQIAPDKFTITLLTLDKKKRRRKGIYCKQQRDGLDDGHIPTPQIYSNVQNFKMWLQVTHFVRKCKIDFFLHICCVVNIRRCKKGKILRSVVTYK